MRKFSALVVVVSLAVSWAALGQNRPTLAVDDVMLRNWMQSTKGQQQFRAWVNALSTERIVELEAIIVPVPDEQEKIRRYARVLRELKALRLDPTDPLVVEVKRRLDALQ